MNGRCVFGAQYKQEDKEIMLYEEKSLRPFRWALLVDSLKELYGAGK